MEVKTEKPYYTPKEYLANEKTSEYRSEYYNGEIIPMSGGTTNHNIIAGHFYKRFPLRIGEQSYKIFSADVRLYIPLKNWYVYPDVMVIQGKAIYA